MNEIPISCKCITYGRVEYIEESIESFIKQEYNGESELVIVNDYPLQKLYYDHPRVRIFNLDKTFDTIGEKENFAVEQCKYDTIAVWDDDDMALPNHLQNINKYFPGHDLLHWNKGILLVSNSIANLGCLGNSGIVYNKQIWEKVGKHELENAGYDMTFVIKIQNSGGKVARVYPPDDEVSWLYSWGGGSYHMSGMGTDTPDRDNVIKRHTNYIESLRILGKIPTGNIYLTPHWKYDYNKMLSDFITKNLNKIEVKILNNNFIVRPDHRLNEDIWKLINNNGWEQHTFQNIKSIENTEMFWDIGAWIGPMSLLASKIFNRVISFEPDKTALKYLKENIELNNVNNIIIQESGVYSYTGDINFGYNGNIGFGSSMSSINHTSEDNYSISTVTLFDMIEKYGKPSCIKIDIEGGEEYIIDDLIELDIENIILSVHTSFIKDIVSFNKKMDRLLNKYNIINHHFEDYFLKIKV